MLTFTISKDGYKTYSGSYMVEPFDKVHDIELDEIGYTFETEGDWAEVISADAQMVLISVKSYDDMTRQLIVPIISDTSNCEVTLKHQYDRVTCQISVPENQGRTDRSIKFTLTQPGSDKTINIELTQRYYSYTFESFSLVPNMEYTGGSGSVWVKSLRDDKPFIINRNNVSIHNITGATIDNVELDLSDAETGMYRISYTIPENTGTSNRKAIIKVTHPVLIDVIRFEIEQNYYDPTATKKVNTVITPIFNSNMGTVSYDLYFDATNFNGGTLRNVCVEVRNTSDVTGDLLASKTYGDITVAKGTKSDTYIGLFRNIDILNPWVLVYYDNNLQYKANCMQELPEVDPRNQ
jgi:hypothetical protein